MITFLGNGNLSSLFNFKVIGKIIYISVQSFMQVLSRIYQPHQVYIV